MDLRQAFSLNDLEEASSVEDDLRFQMCEALRDTASMNPPQIHITLSSTNALILADILESSLMMDILHLNEI